MKKTGVLLGLAALLSLSCLVSCINTDNTLGSGLVPANQDISIHTATLDLPVTMKMADSLQTSINMSGTVGAIRTERFGLYHSDAAFTLTAAYDSIIWGKNPSVRSITVTLTRDTSLVMDASQLHIPQNIYFHLLKTQLDSTKIFHNSLTAADYEPETVSDGGVVYTGDNTYTVKLKSVVGERLLKLPMSTLDSATLMMKAFPGFYMRCDDPVEGMEGGRLNIFDLSSSYLTFTYDYDDEEGNRRTGTSSFMMGQYYCVNITNSGSRNLEKADPADGLYMEGNCGIKPHLKATELKATVERWAAANQIPIEKLIIAKATVSFPFEYVGDRHQFDYYATNLFPCKRVTASDKLARYSPLSEMEDGEMETGTIDRSHLCYTSNISIYLQGLLRRDGNSLTAADDLWMMPTLTTYDSSTGASYYFADYYYYAQSYLNGTGDVRHPELQLTYTILK